MDWFLYDNGLRLERANLFYAAGFFVYLPPENIRDQEVRKRPIIWNGLIRLWEIAIQLQTIQKGSFI